MYLNNIINTAIDRWVPIIMAVLNDSAPSEKREAVYASPAVVLAVACVCEAQDYARYARALDVEDLDNVGLYICDELLSAAVKFMSIAIRSCNPDTVLPTWNPDVYQYWAR